MVRIISILATTFDGNKGAAAMLKSIVRNLDAENKNYYYNLLSVYPKSDREQNPFKNLKVISCKPQNIIFIGFPLAVLFYLFRWFNPVKKILLKNKILKGFYQSDLVVDAAGISFVDSRGFIMNAYNFICMAVPLLLGKRIVKYSQALGPFKNFWNRTMARKVLPKIYKICARGEITKNHLDSLGLTNTLICADGAFSLPGDPDAEKKIKEIIKEDNFYSKKIVSVSLSSVVEKYCNSKGLDYKDILSKFIDYLIEEKNYGVLIIANSVRKGSLKSRNNDLVVCQEIYNRVKNKKECRWYDDIFTPEELRVLISFSWLMVASRFHAMIAALHTNVPVFLVGWSHKYKEVLDMFSLGENAIDYRELSLEKLEKEFNRFEQKREEIYRKIEKALPEIKESSKKNIEIIKRALQDAPQTAKSGILDYDNPQKYIGDFTNTFMGYSNDPEIRKGAASGGIVTSILIYLLEKGEIDGALVSKQVMTDGKIGARTFIARTRQEILDCRTSIYFDFPFKKSFKDILEFDGKVGVVALPCVLEKLEKWHQDYPQLKEKIPYRISLYCGGNNSPELAEKVLKKNRIKLDEVERIYFRKGPWRGLTNIAMKDGSEKNMSYIHNIWTYRNLYYYSLPKCFSCQNHFGFNSDISCGDFLINEMRENPIKHTSIVARNEKSEKLLSDMEKDNVITLQSISEKDLLKSQKRALIYKFNTALARKKVGEIFGLECKAKNLQKSKWNYYLAAFFIVLNIKLSKSKLIDIIPNRILFIYVGFLKILISL